jgi:hypothetical protein
MAVIETMTFRLLPEVDDDSFAAVDKRLQTDFAYQQPGLVRRTTAQGVGPRAGDWIVIDLWRSAEDADACTLRWEADPLARELMAMVDPGSVDVRRYADLEG